MQYPVKRIQFKYTIDCANLN